MSKLVRRILIIAGSCIVLGLVLLTAGRALGGRPGFYINSQGIFTTSDKMRMQGYTRTAVMEKQIVESFDQISIQVFDNNIEVLPSGDNSYYVEYQIPLREKDQDPVFEITDGVLTFTYGSNNSFNYSMGFMVIDNKEEPKNGFVRLYIPRDAQLKNTTLSNNDGEITIRNLLSDKLSVSAKYGAIVMEQVEGKTLSVKSSDGEISCTDGNFDTWTVENIYGDTNLSGLTAVNITIKSSDGEVNCTDGQSNTWILENKYSGTNLSGLTAENITIKSSDGDILINDIQTVKMEITNKYGGITGNNIKADIFSEKQTDGSCTLNDFDVKDGKFNNTYGSISLLLTDAEQDYNYNLRTKYGNIKLNSQSFEEDEDGTYAKDNKADNKIDAEAKNGSIRITTK